MRYLCETCGKFYVEQENCLNCEVSHKEKNKKLEQYGRVQEAFKEYLTLFGKYNKEWKNEKTLSHYDGCFFVNGEKVPEEEYKKELANFWYCR